MFLADLITNSKRLKFTRRQMRVLLAYARETQGEDIPSLKSIKKMQQRLKKKLGDPTARKVSPSGNIFYMNKMAEGIARVCLLLSQLVFLLQIIVLVYRIWQILFFVGI
jgi:hypothetical protein